MPAEPVGERPGMFAGASPKLTFILGLVTGVAVVSIVGFAVAASFAFSGKLTNKGLNAPSAQQPATADPQEPATLGRADIQLKPSDYVQGSPNAPVTIVTYSDLECPYCQRFHPSVAQSLRDYPNQVKWVFRHFPLSFHVNAQKEAEAAECVGKLGGAEKYWKFIDTIFERTTSNGTGFALTELEPLAKEIGVNSGQFRTCLDQGEMTTKVQGDLQEASGYGVGGTPTTFVNGIPVEGAVPYDQFKAAIDQALSEL